MTVDDWFSFDRGLWEEAKKVALRMRKDFTPVPSEDDGPWSMGSAAISIYVDRNLAGYFNGDLVFAVAIYIAAVSRGAGSDQLRAYFGEDAVIRVFSLWDYIFQVMREWLGLNLTRDRQMFDEIKSLSVYDIDFVPDPSGSQKVVYTPKNAKDSREALRAVHEATRYMMVDKRARAVRKQIRREYADLGFLEEIVNNYRTQHVVELRDLRDTIIHTHHLSATMRFASGPMPTRPGDMSIRVSPQQLIEERELRELLRKNVRTLKDSIVLLQQAISREDLPKPRSLMDQQFLVAHLPCPGCKRTFSVPNQILDLLREDLPMICPLCGQDFPVPDEGEYESSETNHFIYAELLSDYPKRYSRARNIPRQS